MSRLHAVPRIVGKPSVLLWVCLFGWAEAVSAFAFGHARLLSGPQQILRADIPIVQLRAQELAQLRVRIAPESAWRQAGLTPPVDLSSLQVQLRAGLTDSARIARIHSSQKLTGTVADFLIDVQTVTGVQRHQVSLLAQHFTLTLPAGGEQTLSSVSPATVTVRRGDTLFSIARRHAAAGFSAYQMMAALFYTNPNAFIDGNMNLVKAEASLRLPDAATLSKLSDRQARQLFIQHAQAYAQRRAQGLAEENVQSATGLTQTTPAPSAQQASAQHTNAPQSKDQLTLRVANAEDIHTGAGTASLDAELPHAPVAARDAVQNSLARIAQLEDNVQELNQVLQEVAQMQETTQTQTRILEQTSTPTAVQPNQTNNGAVVPPTGLERLTVQSTGADTQRADALAAPTAQRATDAASTPTNILWTMVAAGVALLVLLIVWLRRRARIAVDNGGKITDAMIQEKLNTIDLNLNQNEPSARRT